jgi:hypothetical protein
MTSPQNHRRFGSGLAQDARVTLFPLVARWRQTDQTEELEWAGAAQIKEAFAHHLFDLWRPLLVPAGTLTGPVVAWHGTDGKGYCLLQITAEGDELVASALLLSRTDALQLGFDPFLLLYGNVLPSTTPKALRPICRDIAALAQAAEEVVAVCFDEEERNLACTACAGWARDLDPSTDPNIVAPGPRELMLAGLYLWPHLPAAVRAQTSLVLSPPVGLTANAFSPRLTVALPNLAPPAIEPAPLRDLGDLEAVLGGAPAEVKPHQDITAELLGDLDGGLDLTRTRVLERVSDACAVRDAAGYRHLLDRLVCGLEPRIADLSPDVLLELLLAYCPKSHRLDQHDESWVVFDDALSDIVNFARVGLNDDVTRSWLHAAVNHRHRDLLPEIGLPEALGRQIGRVFPAGARDHLKTLLNDPSMEDLPADERGRVRELAARIGFAANPFGQVAAPAAPSVSHAVPPATETKELVELPPTPVVPEPEALGDAERRACVEEGVLAIESLLNQDSGMTEFARRTTSAAPTMTLEERVMSSWGLTDSSASVLLWESLGGADAHGALAAMVHAARAPTQETAEKGDGRPQTSSHPVGISVVGPHTSVRRLNDAVAAVSGDLDRMSQLLPSTRTTRPSLEHVRYDTAGPAVRCAALRNIWARARGTDGGARGVGRAAGATLVAPMGGLPQWPQLWERARGVVFVVDAPRLLASPQSLRDEAQDYLDRWSRCRPFDLRVAIVLTGCDRLTDPTIAPLRNALDGAFSRLAHERGNALSEGVLGGLLQLGPPTMRALGGNFLVEHFAALGATPAVFPMPSPGAVSILPLHDLPLVWLLSAAGVRLNLDKKSVERSAMAMR